MAQAATGRTPLMAGNWKMNLDHLQATHLVQKLDWTLRDARHDFGAVEVAVLPPFTDLRSVQTLIEGDRLQLRHGAQDLSPHDSGAWTGDVSGAFLARLKCVYVVVGHSERRAAPPRGRRRRQRQGAGGVPARAHPDPVRGRGAGGPPGGRPRRARAWPSSTRPWTGVPAEQARSIVIAYEPVWAVGTGEVATPADAQEVCAALRTRLAELYSGDTADGIRILYGGSVKAGNVAALMAETDVDGALVGGASIVVEEFASICRYREHVTAGS